MKRTFLLPLTLAVAIAPATVVASHRAEAEIRGFYWAYLHRAPSPIEMQNWLCQFDRGLSLECIEAKILASEEFFLQTHNCHRRYIALVYAHVVGRPPCPAEIEHWICRLNQLRCRYTMTCEILRWARGGIVPAPPPGVPVSQPRPVIRPDYPQPTAPVIVDAPRPVAPAILVPAPRPPLCLGHGHPGHGHRHRHGPSIVIGFRFGR